MILVTGTGWNGSTVFIKLLRGLGFTITPPGVDRQAYELLKDKELVAKMASGKLPWPDAVKHLGGLCFNLNDWVQKYHWDVRWVFVLVRPLNDAVAKRREKGGMNRKALIEPLPDFELTPEQLDVATKTTIRATVGAAVHEIIEGGYDCTMVNYPKFTLDQDYCWSVISNVYHDRERFNATWDAIMDPYFVNKYEKSDDDPELS